VRYLPLAIVLAAGATAAALAQGPAVPAAVTKRTPPAAGQSAVVATPATPDATPQALPPSGGTALMLRGLDKVTGHPTDILAPIGREVHYATLSITARFCYSTPASETPETTAFVQIDDHRPDQPARKVFSGWMYASSPGLNPMDHPTYDVWVIGCNNAAASSPAAVTASAAPVKVASPDSSDKEKVEAMPEGAGR
jgi:hypothetical protein